MLVIVVFVAIKAGQRFVELRAVRIVLDSAFEEILPELEIFALRFDPQGEPRLGGIVQGGGARVPRHVPGRHVPEQKRARLQRRDLAKKKQHAAPFRSLPGHVRLDEKDIRDQRTKTAQTRR